MKFFDRKGDKDFAIKLGKWLREFTGENWQLEQIAESGGTPTASEQSKADAKADPLVADALGLFAGAEIVKIG